MWRGECPALYLSTFVRSRLGTVLNLTSFWIPWLRRAATRDPFSSFKTLFASFIYCTCARSRAFSRFRFYCPLLFRGWNSSSIRESFSSSSLNFRQVYFFSGMSWDCSEQLACMLQRSICKQQISIDIIVMDQQLLERLVNIRREFHQYPEVSLQEHQTRVRIQKFLFELGVTEVTRMNPTALVVDLKGRLPPSGRNICVAFRADMDALSMTELNTDLPYRSVHSNAAHMCGHDGHMTCLLGFAALFLPKLAQIPSNKVIRLLFQPSEEGPASGAKMMIEQGCLKDVDEVYGFHQWPSAPMGQLWCKAGPVMSQITVLKIKIYGTGGHGSEPETLKIALYAALQFYRKFMGFLEHLGKEKPGKFVCTLPVFQAGERYNVISDSCVIEGTIRSFQNGLAARICFEITGYLQQIASQGFKYEFNSQIGAPINSNSEKQAENVLRVAREHFGADKVGHGKLPFRASEDFAYFTQEKPGAFFFLSSGHEKSQAFIHNPYFNFNDQLIESAAGFWVKLALDRIHAE